MPAAMSWANPCLIFVHEKKKNYIWRIMVPVKMRSDVWDLCSSWGAKSHFLLSQILIPKGTFQSLEPYVAAWFT